MKKRKLKSSEKELEYAKWYRNKDIKKDRKRTREYWRQYRQDVIKILGSKCVKCGSNENLEFDHIIPFSKGGSSTARNLQLLCEECNRQKSDNI